MRIPKSNVMIAALLGALIICAGFSGYEVRQNYLWKQRVRGLAGYAGEEEARRSFAESNLSLYVTDFSRHGFSPTNDGPCRVYPLVAVPNDYPTRYATEQQASAYNIKMKALYEARKRRESRTSTEHKDQ